MIPEIGHFALILAVGVALYQTLVPLYGAQKGDVALMRMCDGAAAKHLGVLAEDGTGAPTLIHAYSGRGVVESALGEAWRRRIVAVFRLPAEGN